MPAHVIIVTSDSSLADAWEKQLPAGRSVLRADRDSFDHLLLGQTTVVLLIDLAASAFIKTSSYIHEAIIVGEPNTINFEQARLNGSGKVFISYRDSCEKIAEIFPLVEEIAEKGAMVRILLERLQRHDLGKRVNKESSVEFSELWDFLEGAVENLDARERLIAEFRRASRSLLHASHAVFFLREADGFRADRGTSFFPVDDPMVTFFENHPAVVDGTRWDGPSDPLAEITVRNRLALWGAKMLVPIHDNGRLLGLIALGIRNDGQIYDESDKDNAIFFARLLRNLLSKANQFVRLSQAAAQVAIGSRYFPGTIVLASEENAPRHLPLVVRDLIGQVRRSKNMVRAMPCVGQPFRASAGMIAETGGVWACWEEASAEVYDAIAREKTERRHIMRDLALTLSHELGNALVSLTTFRQSSKERPVPEYLLETIKSDVAHLEALNGNLAVMQRLHESEASIIDIRDLVQNSGRIVGVRVEVGPDPIMLNCYKDLMEYAIGGVLLAIGERRSEHSLAGVSIKVRSTGIGTDATALLAIRGGGLELEGVLPEPSVEGVPHQGRIVVFLAKEILRLHGGEIHSGPGIDGVEILLSIKSI